MKHLLVPLLLAISTWSHPANAAESFLQDGGFDEANETLAKVTALIAEARAKGIDVLYWQAAAIPMRVGLNERWKSFPEERPDTLRYVEKHGQETVTNLSFSQVRNMSHERSQ